jgi:chaperonin cofactor prefoldin
LPESQPNSVADLISQARRRLSQELRAQTDELQKLEQSLQTLRNRQRQLEAEIQLQLETLGKFTPSVSLDKVLGSVRNLITATLPEQVFATLAEEAEQMGVRAAVFDIRGKAAWGAAARGFGPELSDKAFRALVVPLNKDNPFRQAYETGGHVDATVELLKKSRNVLDKFNPSPNVPILLLPIRSAGSVSAIFYSDPGGRAKELPVDALKILAEFAGAQLDRLMALSGGLPAAAAEQEVAEAEPVAGQVSSQAEGSEPAEPVASAGNLGASVVEAPPRAPAPSGRVVEPPAASAAPPAQGLDISELNEADQKVHKDAKRFAKLLISEIDLYNKAKVADGRKNSDLYRRLKADIDRSRQTYEKRFGKTVARRYDYFHEELVRTLAGNEPSLLGSDYPGPSV